VLGSPPSTLAGVTKGLYLRTKDSRSLRSSRIPSKDEDPNKVWELTPEGRSIMVTYADKNANPSDRESTGQGGVPIAPGSEPSITGSRRRAKWFIGGVLAIALFACGAAGIAVANHTRHIGSAGSATSSVKALQRWWAGAETDFTDMRNASEDVDQAFSRPGALAAACQHVHDAAEVKMQSRLPSPNRKLTAELDGAIKNFGFAAHLCLTGVAGSPGNYDGEFLSVMAQGNKHMRTAQDIIDQILINV
jgi:hypothetical protein